MTTHLHPSEVEVGPFWVSDLPKATLIKKMVELSLPEHNRTALAFALHVGGLNSRRDRDFVTAMRRADIVYADGGSVVWLAKLARAHHIERAPTTDLGWEVLRGFVENTGRLPRVALIGGPPGLAARAKDVLVTAGVAEVVHVDHGYHASWAEPLSELREADPDVTIIGLGAPREMVWCEEHRAALPSGLVLTCGGWFGHLVGDEKRAPRLLRRSGLEWIARVVQAPTRLGPRYIRGVVVTAALATKTVQRRPRSSRR